MKKSLVSLGLLLLSNCGGETGPPFEGVWAYEDKDQPCAIIIDMKDGKFSSNAGCLLQNGEFGFEREEGDYTHTSTTISFVPRFASCPQTDHSPWTDVWVMSNGGSNLSLRNTEAAIVLDRVIEQMKASSMVQAGNTGGAIVRWGCWNDGRFFENPIFQVR